MPVGDQPLFAAVCTSARQIFLLLRCIAFAPKAEVLINAEGLRFSVEEAHVVQGFAFLERNLFSSFTFHPVTDRHGEAIPTPPFQINLPALLETLQIFGMSENDTYKNRNGGFSASYSGGYQNAAFGMGASCQVTYPHVGAPLNLVLTEAGVTTTCELATYDPEHAYNSADITDQIPFQREALILKIIMKSSWLADAIQELSNTNPEVLLLSASSHSAPYLAFEGLEGPFGDSMIEYQPDKGARNYNPSSSNRQKKQPQVTETFMVSAPHGSKGRVKQRYKFDLVKKAGRAMRLASKVSIRGDVQGVLSLQFMIEMDANGVSGRKEKDDESGAFAVTRGNISFVDFRFVPQLDPDDDSDAANDQTTASE